MEIKHTVEESNTGKNEALRRQTADSRLEKIVSTRLAALVEFSNDAIIATTLDLVITSWNPAAERTFGYSSAEAIGQLTLMLTPPERADEEAEILIRILRGECVQHFETVKIRKDRRWIDVSMSISPIRDASGDIVGAWKIARDITALKERERKSARLSRLHAALSQINHAIVRVPTNDRLFHKICQALVEHGGFRMAWIGWHDLETHELLPMAVWGEEADYLQSIKVYTDDRSENRDPAGVAFRAGCPYVCNDVLNDPSASPTALKQCGFRAYAVFLIRRKDEVCGTLNVYSDEPYFFQDTEVALLNESALDISFALENFAKEEARLQAEQGVCHERDFSRAVINSMPGVFYLYDKTGKFLRWNKNFEDASGYTSAEIATMHPLDFFVASDKEMVSARINEVFQKGTSTAEAGFLSKDGRVTPYYFTGTRIQIDDQLCLIGVGIDLTDRKQAEMAQLASEARYRTLFEYAPDGIVIADAESFYIDGNASMCEMLGYTRDEFIGLHASNIVVPDEARHIEPALNQIKTNADHHREWKLRRKDNSVFPADVMATMMPDGNLMGMIRDITERKQAEAALRELNDTLELKVTERTNELQVALVRAESADRLKSAFLATMSHELRTPLNSIIGFTGIMLQGLAGSLNPEQNKQLGMVQGSARHLLELINDVLDLSKIEAAQLELQYEPFNLLTSIERVTASMKPLAMKKELSLVTAVSPGLSEMVSDRRRVEQILINLINNAIKFTDQGDVTLMAEMVDDFRLSLVDESRSAVRFRVVDTGVGIKHEDLLTLFQPFRQIDAGITRKHEGTGLGLVICRRLVGLLGGEISAKSEWSKGSEFTVILPLQKTK
ncbi:MAG: PAS domain S-box protein [Pseudomonadota bacterium]